MTVIVANGVSLDEYLRGIAPGNRSPSGLPIQVGREYNAWPDGLTINGYPVVRLLGADKSLHFAEIKSCGNPRQGDATLGLREGLLERINGENIGAEPVRVRLTGMSDKTDGIHTAVCVPDLPGYGAHGFAPKHAHSAISSGYIFQVLCSSNSVEPLGAGLQSVKTIRVLGYDSNGSKFSGIVKPVHRKRPDWEVTSDPIDSEIEYLISGGMLNGSERIGFKGITVGDRLLVRVVGNNSNRIKFPGKFPVTYFFEPVVTIRKSDEAYGSDDIQKITQVVNINGELQADRYEPADMIRHLPIVGAFETKRLGTVGVGYVRRPRAEFQEHSRASYSKKVFVMNAAEYNGSLIDMAGIVSNNPRLIVASLWS